MGKEEGMDNKYNYDYLLMHSSLISGSISSMVKPAEDSSQF